MVVRSFSAALLSRICRSTDTSVAAHKCAARVDTIWHTLRVAMQSWLDGSRFRPWSTFSVLVRPSWSLQVNQNTSKGRRMSAVWLLKARAGWWGLWCLQSPMLIRTDQVACNLRLHSHQIRFSNETPAGSSLCRTYSGWTVAVAIKKCKPVSTFCFACFLGSQLQYI